MSKVLWNYLLVIPALFGGLVVLSSAAPAAEVEQIAQPTQQVIPEIDKITPTGIAQKTSSESSLAPVNAEPLGSTVKLPVLAVPSDRIEQVTSVSQLSDVQPTDWAFQALQSLVERYGVITGYPDGTFKGNRTLTRYEFAAGLNAALDRLNELIATSTGELVRKEDLATLQKLQEQFAAELTTLRGRVDALETRSAKLEATQFSTTTKLLGLAQFFVGDTFGNRVGTNRDNTNVFFSYRATLALQTSFTGKDQLTTSLTAVNSPVLGAVLTGTPQTRFNTERNTFYTDGSVYLDRLFYRFPLGAKTTVWIGARALQPVTFAPTLNPLIGNGQSGTLSRFAFSNPVIYRPGFDGAGAAFAYKFNNQLQLNAGYIVDDGLANNPAGNATNRGGLFGNSYEALGQLTFTPSRSLDISFAYAHKYFPAPIAVGTGATAAFGSGYNITGGTGTTFAIRPFGAAPTSSDNFGLQFNWKASGVVNVGGWFGYTLAHQEGTNNDATIINGALTLAFPDLFKKANLGGLVFGIPPKVTSNDNINRRDKDTSLHLEGFYTYRLNDNISVTPTLFVILNPEGNSANDPIWVGAIRSTFNF
ncbi:MAG: iron uptake porin [Nostoc sp.]|uniref:iron uptake porin n=1 Tax=Nostoc sp. TaxID=1180 RepID=UPI002FF84A73